METAIYRIIQESLTNTAKHAHAQKVWVAPLRTAGGPRAHPRKWPRLRRAAVLKTPWQDRGLGLAGMMERATLLDGTVDIHRSQALARRLTSRIPLRVERAGGGAGSDDLALQA